VGRRARSLFVESFELAVLRELRARGIRGTYVYLVEADGAPFDLVAAHGAAATPYRDQVSAAGLARLAREVDGISVDKAMLLSPALRGPSWSPTPTRRGSPCSRGRVVPRTRS
jgi:glycerophosphoryl diester phosphodiesterase